MRFTLTMTATALLGGCLVLSLGGCKSAATEDQLLAELANQDKEAIFNRAEELFAAEEYKDARRYFSFVYDTFPNDPLGHKAALRVADTYALKRDSTSLTEARLRYRDFANRYPNDPDRDYALLKLGQTYSSRQLQPDRDLSSLEEALSAYNQLITLYPNSKYLDVAKERVAELREVRAEHEYQVARFYYRNKRWRAVLWRLDRIKTEYPEFSKMAEVDELHAEMNAVVTQLDEAIAKFREAQAKKQLETHDEQEEIDGAGENE
jgi:outer membrane protein assembly factor BamD